MPRIVSLFSGCGGLDLGFEQEGYETVWANDFKHEACVTFANHFGNVIREGDVEAIDPYNDPDILARIFLSYGNSLVSMERGGIFIEVFCVL